MRSETYQWMIYASWLFLVVYVTVSAIGVKPDTHTHSVQSLGLLCAIVVAFLLPGLPFFHFVNFAPPRGRVSSIGVSLDAAGIVFFVWARHHLGRNWSQAVAVKQGHELVTSGPYRFVRHPMYAGGLVACLGSAIVCGGPFVFLLILLGAIFLWRVRAEDQLLARQFPEQYPDYEKRTKKLIPFVW